MVNRCQRCEACQNVSRARRVISQDSDLINLQTIARANPCYNPKENEDETVS